MSKVTPEDVYQWFPELKTGETTRIESPEAGDWVPCYEKNRDGEGSGWYKVAYAENFEVRNGKLYMEIVVVDECGDWEVVGEEEVGTPEGDKLWREYVHSHAHLEREKEYDEFVLETGEDPLELYRAKTPEERRDAVRRRRKKMPRFRGVVKGSAGSTSRTGSTRSGLEIEASAWGVGIRVVAAVVGDKDVMQVYKTNGYGDHVGSLIAEVAECSAWESTKGGSK